MPEITMSGNCFSSPVTARWTQSVGVPLTWWTRPCALRTGSGRLRVWLFIIGSEKVAPPPRPPLRAPFSERGDREYHVDEDQRDQGAHVAHDLRARNIVHLLTGIEAGEEFVVSV